MTIEERKAALVKNGISVSDLEKAGKDAYKRGYDDGVTTTYKSIYAALCLALNETMGFGKKRLRDVLQKTDQIVLEQLTSMETIEEVWNKIGLQLVFDDPEMLTVVEASRVCGLCYNTMQDVVRAGKIKSLRCGNIILIPRPSLLLWLRDRSTRQLDSALMRMGGRQ